MADNYVSTNVESGVKMREALNKINSYKPESFVWIETSKDITVDLKSPTSSEGISDPGNYVIYNFSNGPSEIPSTVSPVLLSIMNGKNCVSANGEIYVLNNSGDTWEDINDNVDDTTVLYIKSDTAPNRTSNTFWFDTSKFNDSENGEISLKYFDSTTEIPFSTEGTISSTSRYWWSVCYGNDKFVAITFDDNYFAYSTDGINWTEGTISSTSRYWRSVCYGNDKFVAVAGNNSTYFAYSTDGINWTEGTISSTSRDWYSVCYGNGKFVTVAYDSNYFAYSTDGINWTEGTISSTSRLWESICYGNGKFVTIAENSYFAYSTDGINWTEGTISSTNREWISVCYGNDKFVTIAYDSNYFAYSTDGINWTESTISSSRWWESVCYGNGKFVTIAENSYFAYSTDGINWTEGTISDTNREWISVCYGNDKFVAVANNNKYFANITFGPANEWISVFSNTDLSNYLKKSELDPSGIGTDIYQYIDDKISQFIDIYNNFNKHKNNELTYIHVTEDDVNRYANIITEDTLKGMIENILTPNMQNDINDCYNYTLEGSDATQSFVNLRNAYDTHINTHVTADDISSWNNKSEVDHTHVYTDNTVKIDGSQIVAGTFDNSQLPDEIKERYYKISSTPEEEFSNTSITDEDRSSKYHNGNAFYYETTDSETGDTVRTWYRIIDSTKVGTTSWADGVIDFTAKKINMNWDSVEERPTTLAEFGIENPLYTKTYVDDNLNPYSDQNVTMNASLDPCEGTSEYDYTMNISKIGIQYKITDITDYTDTMTGTIPQVDCIILTSDDKIYKTTYNLNSKYLKQDGSYYTTSDSKEPLGATMIEVVIPTDETASSYFTNRFASDYSTMDANPNYSTSGCGICVTASSTAKTLNVPDPTDNTKTLCTIEYSTNGIKFIYNKPKMLDNIINVAVGSTDKLNCISDTYENMKLNIVKEYGGSYSNTISDTNRYWESVCYGNNNKFVTVDPMNNYFAYSTDGINWTEGTISDTERAWQSVCYGNDKFVTVAYNSNYFAYSTDGINWTEGTISDTSREWSSVCYGNGKFVTVAYNSNYFAYSTDGINWTEGTISDNSRFWFSVYYGNGKFVTVADSTNYFAYSTDGINWTEGTISSTSRDWESVCYGNGMFVTVAYNSKYLAYSTDGINWTEGTTSDTSRYWRAVCYGNDKFVAIANDTNYFAYSTDGIKWYEVELESTLELNSVCYSPELDRFVAVGPSGFTIINAPESWTAGTRSTLAVTYTWTNISSDNTSVLPATTTYVKDTAITVDTKYTDKSVYVVSDGYYTFSGWDKSDFNITEDTTISGSWSDEVKYFQWTEGTISSTSRRWESVCYGNDKFVAVAYSTNYFAYSTDGITWTEGTISSTSRKWMSVCYGNDKFVAVAESTNYFAYSDDGITWTEGTISSTSRTWKSVCYGNGKFVAVSGGTGSKYFAYSTDGITWTESTISSTSRRWISVCYGNGMFIVITFNGNSYFAYSTDGITWTEGTISSTNRYWHSVCYGNGKFVVVARNTNYFAYSTDGITWTEGTISDTSRYWYFVCYGNGKYVAISGGSNTSKYFAYSMDGITWTEGTISDTSRTWKSVCYGNGKFVAVSDSSKYFAYSTGILNEIPSDAVILNPTTELK